MAGLPQTRSARLLLVSFIVGLLVLVAWFHGHPEDDMQPVTATPTGPSASRTPGPPASTPTEAPTEVPTEMPNGESIPSPSPGKPSHLGEGHTASVKPVRTKAPVPLRSVGDFGTGLTVRLSRIAATRGVARAPGEIAGPAVAVTVRADNDSDRPISLDGVIVFLSYGSERTPAIDFGEGSRPLQGDLAAEDSTTGTYIFAVPVERRGDVRVEISYTGKAPTVAFEGSVDGQVG